MLTLASNKVLLKSFYLLGKALSDELLYVDRSRVDMVREKYLENEIFSRSGKSQGILWMVREI